MLGASVFRKDPVLSLSGLLQRYAMRLTFCHGIIKLMLGLDQEARDQEESGREKRDRGDQGLEDALEEVHWVVPVSTDHVDEESYCTSKP
jgi:hypothetical protein